MKKIMLLLLCTYSLMSLAQTKYEMGMQKALQQWQSGHPKEAIAILERIAASAPDNWIPVYYNVFIQITTGMNNPYGDEVEEKINQNRLLIEQWLDQGGAEWYVLKGMNETLELMTDPMNKGMVQSSIITQAYEKARALDPKNPRASYALASFKLNSAAFMKIDQAKYCAMLQQALDLFEQQEIPLPFYPSWGKDWAIKAKEHCGEPQ